MELALTGDPITAERGAELGLVNRVAEPGTAVDVALELAAAIAKNGPLALKATKQILEAQWDWDDSDFFAKQGEYGAALFTDSVGRCDEDVVHMRGGDGEMCGHADSAGVVQGRRCPHPPGGDADDVGTHLGHDPRGLREPDIPTHQQADPSDRGVEHLVALIAGGEPELLGVPEMGLAVAADVTGRADQDRGVVQPITVTFHDAGDEV